MDPQTPPTADQHTSTPPAVRDRRPVPAAALPRNLQVWVMAGLAAIIVGIIVLTGHRTPAARPLTATVRSDTPAALSDRIRGYQQQLADDQVRQEQQQARDALTREATPRPASPDAASRDAFAEERRRREYQSLFADNVALSHRPAAAPVSSPVSRAPSASPSMTIAPAVAPVVDAGQPAIGASTDRSSLASTSRPASRSAGADVTAERRHDEFPASGPRHRLLEGTVIEGVLTNRLEGALAGPVNALVTSPVFSLDRQAMVIPAGARVLGNATPVQSWGESRMAVSFHRLVMPDGHTYSLDQFKGLDQIGATGLRDAVNRHYAQVFGASLAIGAIAGLAQFQTRSGFETSFADNYRQAAGSSLATSSARVLDRYLNVLPTITIREGYRLKVYLTNDLELPAYETPPQIGGVQ